MILINAISIPQVFRGQILDVLTFTFIVMWFNSEKFQKFLFIAQNSFYRDNFPKL